MTVKTLIDRPHCLEMDLLGFVFFPKHWGLQSLGQDLNVHLILHEYLPVVRYETSSDAQQLCYQVETKSILFGTGPHQDHPPGWGHILKSL